LHHGCCCGSWLRLQQCRQRWLLQQGLHCCRSFLRLRKALLQRKVLQANLLPSFAARPPVCREMLQADVLPNEELLCGCGS